MWADDHDPRSDDQLDLQEAATLRPSRNNLDVRKQSEADAVRAKAAKVDFVKVRVTIGTHQHVLSRYLLCRLLIFTKIPSKDAITITVDLKKSLVEQNRLEVTQDELRERLFEVMHKKSYGRVYQERYHLVSHFQSQRIPLLILIAGTGCVGKGRIANSLAARLNLPTVLQTKMVYQLMCSWDSSLCSVPIYMKHFRSSEDCLVEYKKRCVAVRKGLQREIEKTLKEGKSLIIEGLYLDPSLYQSILTMNSSGEPDRIVMPAILEFRDHDFLLNSHMRFYNMAHTVAASPPIPYPTMAAATIMTSSEITTSTTDNGGPPGGQPSHPPSQISLDNAASILQNFAYINEYLMEQKGDFISMAQRGGGAPVDILHNAILDRIAKVCSPQCSATAARVNKRRS